MFNTGYFYIEVSLSSGSGSGSGCYLCVRIWRKCYHYVSWIRR